MVGPVAVVEEAGVDDEDEGAVVALDVVLGTVVALELDEADVVTPELVVEPREELDVLLTVDELDEGFPFASMQ